MDRNLASERAGDLVGLRVGPNAITMMQSSAPVTEQHRTESSLLGGRHTEVRPRESDTHA